MERLTNGLEQRPVSCDIEDYIHEQLLNGLINKSLCESISGSMTGLGLLGTFLGLIIGLKDFSTDYDGIQNSILMLLNGIKTSFLTSIYGVVFSLVFNWMYRGCYTDMMNALRDFYQSFHDKAVQPAQNDMNFRLITALERTGDCLDKILDSISGNITEAIRLCMQDVSSNVKTYVEDAYQLQQTSQETMVTGMEQINSISADHYIAAVKEYLNEFRSHIAETVTPVIEEKFEAYLGTYGLEIESQIASQRNAMDELEREFASADREKLQEELKTCQSYHAALQ